MRLDARGVALFVVRHRWGLLTLATALSMWVAGALAMPAPPLVGGALAAVAASLLLALARLGYRWRTAFAPAERRRTRTSATLHVTGMLLAALFLAGLFMTPAETSVAVGPTFEHGPVPIPAMAALLPVIATPPRFAGAFRPAPRLPALHERGSQPRESSSPAKLEETGLRVLSLNVWHGYPGSGAREERYERIRDLIVELDSDLVLLQESWRTRRFGGLAERLSEELGLGFAYARANGSLRYLGFEEGLAILSRHPISEVRRMALGPRMPPWEMRAALGVLITIPGLEPLEVWNTHLSHSDAFAREGQARTLASALQGSRVAIVAGDFNAGAGSPAVAAFASIDLEPLLSEGIDHILASPGLRDGFTIVRAEALRFGDVEIPGTLLTRPAVSDHPALLLELRPIPARVRIARFKAS